MAENEKTEKTQVIITIISKIIVGVSVVFLAIWIVLIAAFFVADDISFKNSRSDGYIIAEKLEKSNKLIGMNHDDVIELLNNYHEKTEDFDILYDIHDSDGYRIKCAAGSAYIRAGWGPVEPYYLKILFDENDNVEIVNFYHNP